MLCAKPYRQGVMEYGCGQCLPCRIDRRRLWAARLMLELRMHGSGVFFTLTYAPEFLPDGCVWRGVEYRGATLNPKHFTDFIKRVRHYALDEVRYYGVGEYGELRGRPHYHLCLFGHNQTDLLQAVESAWEFGSAARADSLSPIIDAHAMSWDLAWYIAGYVCKRMTKFDDVRLNGRYPEFARMSLRPGIGAHAMKVIADELNTSVGAKIVGRLGDVPYLLKMHGKTLPIGRYLVRKLREEMGYPLETPEKVIREAAQKAYVELAVPGGLELRESVRVQHGRNAKKRYSGNYTKRKSNEAF